MSHLELLLTCTLEPFVAEEEVSLLEARVVYFNLLKVPVWDKILRSISVLIM